VDSSDTLTVRPFKVNSKLLDVITAIFLMRMEMLLPGVHKDPCRAWKTLSAPKSPNDPELEKEP
jgi:hypothetical protein